MFDKRLVLVSDTLNFGSGTTRIRCFSSRVKSTVLGFHGLDEITKSTESFELIVEFTHS